MSLVSLMSENGHYIFWICEGCYLVYDFTPVMKAIVIMKLLAILCYWYTQYVSEYFVCVCVL